MGSIGANESAGTGHVRTGLRQVVPRRVGGSREDPDRGRGPPGRQPCRCHSLRCPGDHARNREGVGPPCLRTGRRFLSHHPGGRNPVGTSRRSVRPSRQRISVAEGAGAARARLPRGDEGSVEVLLRALPASTFRSGRIRRDRHARRSAGGAHRRGGVRGDHAGPHASARSRPRPRTPLFPRDGQPPRPRAPGCRRSLPGQFKLRVLDPIHFSVPADQERYSKSRIMEESERVRSQLQEAVYDLLRDRRSVWFG